MTSLLTNLLSLVLPSKNEYRGMHMSLDAAGKTSLLYKLKLNEIVTTIPTIGFNVETVTISNNKSKSDLTLWDVGGCDKIRPLWRHYFNNLDVMIYIIDCTDTDRLVTALEMFAGTILQLEEHLVYMVLLNKIDTAKKENINKCRSAVKHLFQYGINKDMDTDKVAANATAANNTDNKNIFMSPLGNPVLIQEVSVTADIGLTEAFTWLADVLPKWKKNPQAVYESIEKNSNIPVTLPQKKDTPTTANDKKSIDKTNNHTESMLEEWLHREDETDEEFLIKLRNCTLDTWDHYTHLRIAFILITKHGRSAGMKLLFNDIKHFIDNSPRTRGGSSSRGTTFHETMTYFWVHMVDYAIQSMKQRSYINNMQITNDNNSSTNANNDNELILRSPFKLFLFLNPQLSDGGLFLKYYTKQLMLLDGESRKEVKLPDIQPLPSLLVDMNVLKANCEFRKQHGAINNNVHTEVDDTVFWNQCSRNNNNNNNNNNNTSTTTNDKLTSWGHLVKLRLMYLLLCCYGRNNNAITIIMKQLSYFEGGTTHYTINYFWIQLLTYCIATAGKTSDLKFAAFNVSTYSIPDTKLSNNNNTNNDISTSLEVMQLADQTTPPPTTNDENVSSPLFLENTASFSVFIELPSSEPLKNSLLYDAYYSREAIDSDAAVTGLVLPDLKAFPTMVP